MEEEKKENVTTETAPVEAAPVETTPVEPATPVEEVKEEIVSNEEEKVEVLDDEPIEMLEGASVPAPEPEPEPESEPAPAEVATAPANEVVISSEPTAAPEPEPAAPPVVHKVEDSPIANAEAPTKAPEPAPAPEPEVKKEETKVEEKKEEPKKEEKPKANNNKLAIIVMVIALLVGAGYAVKTFVLDAKPSQGGTPSQGTGGSGEPVGPSGGTIVSGLLEEDAVKLLESIIISDSTDANYQPIERIAKNTSVLSTDFTNEEIFFITYNKHFKSKQEFTAEEFQEKVATTLADVTYTPGAYKGDCNDRVFNYDEETGKYTIEMLDIACGIEGYENSVHDAYGYLSNTINDNTLVITIGVFFGKGTDESKDANYYYDYDRNNPVADGIVILEGNDVDRTATDFKKGTKYDLTFNIENGEYIFVKAEQVS